MSDIEKAQHAARETAEQFRILVQGVTDYAIYMLSPAGIVTSWNIGAERIKGYSDTEILGRHFSCFYTDEDRTSGAPTMILATAAREGRAEREGWRVRKDGSCFWAHVVVDAIHDSRGELVGFAKVTRDITERKQAAAALEKANAALFQSQKMEAIGQLTGGIAHDFNNLLAVLSNGLQVLAAQSRTHLDLKMLGGMRRAVDRGASLTQQLLSFARQQPLQAEVHDINVLIQDFEPMLAKVRGNNRSAKCELQLCGQPVFALVDAGLFEAALLNLVANSIDAMPDGGTVTVATSPIEMDAAVTTLLTGGRYARISVSDTGAGMPQKVIDRALEPFFTTKTAGKGTGLGLSQVYGFITQSEGDVVISSVEGEGTTIDLYLPIVRPDASASAPSLVKAETVLLVEDEPDVLELATELFRSIGYKVVVAGNASEAAAILKERNDVDVVFTDITMPDGMSGMELARHVRREYPAVKVVLTSGYPLVSLKNEHVALHEFPFVYKPYRLADLAKALRA
ncbi:PAS domain S-box protein [Paraburkholderia jirisanensis]